MRKIGKSARLKALELRFGKPMTDLLHDWHWQDNLRHCEIAECLGVPRPTVTRWFGALGVPCRSGQRITNLNLLNVGPRLGPRAKVVKPKPKPILVNVNFFKHWSSEMAYVLGFFAADGSMYTSSRGAHYIDFTSTDSELLERISSILRAKQKITRLERHNPKWKIVYHLQIGSKDMFADLLKLGMSPRKSMVIQLPTVPGIYLSHFVRGYFDGDGSILFKSYIRIGRKTPTMISRIRFTSGSRKLLEQLWRVLGTRGIVRGGSIYDRKKSGGYDLCFSTQDTLTLGSFMYNREANGLYLGRKWKICNEARKYYWARRSIG